jgi:hypothetical protein
MLCAMKPPPSILHLADDERTALEAGLRRSDAFIVRH